MATATAQQFVLQARQDEQTRIDRNTGTMRGVSLISEGIAIGHGVRIDDTTLDTVIEAAGGGRIQSYITHAGAIFEDRILKEIGYIENFRLDDDKVRGDFVAFDSFREDDKREYNRLFEMAEKLPDRFGLSIVFGGEKVWATGSGDVEFEYDKDKPDDAMFNEPSVRVLEINSGDFVDEPAANATGLFRAVDKTKKQMTKEQLTAKVTELENQVDAFFETEATLKTQLEAKTGEVEALQAKVDDLAPKAEQVEQLQGQLDAKTTEATEATDKVNQLQADNDLLSQKVDTLSALIKGNTPVQPGGDNTEDEDKPTTYGKADRDKAISEYAAEHNLTEFQATCKLGKLRPELWNIKK
jgi:hypothetical protein